jgi:hypothetical protein
MKPHKVTLLAVTLLACATRPAFAGPPLLTDDPETPGPNQWEINLAVTTEKNRRDWEFEAPLLDLNYGVGERIQLKYEVPCVIVDEHRHGVRGGIGNSLVGVKWRFLDEEKAGVSISTYPQFEFNTLRSSVRHGVAEDGNAYLLPLEIGHDFGVFNMYGECGYTWNERHSDEWFYGVAVERELTETFSLMGELYGIADNSFDDHQLVFNVGFHWKWNEIISLIGSAGHGIHDNRDDRVDLLGYLGVQCVF